MIIIYYPLINHLYLYTDFSVVVLDYTYPSGTIPSLCHLTIESNEEKKKYLNNHE